MFRSVVVTAPSEVTVTIPEGIMIGYVTAVAVALAVTRFVTVPTVTVPVTTSTVTECSVTTGFGGLHPVGLELHPVGSFIVTVLVVPVVIVIPPPIVVPSPVQSVQPVSIEPSALKVTIAFVDPVSGVRASCGYLGSVTMTCACIIHETLLDSAVLGVVGNTSVLRTRMVGIMARATVPSDTKDVPTSR